MKSDATQTLAEVKFNIEGLTRTWLPFRKSLGFSAVRTKKDYARAIELVDTLVDAIGDDEKHSLVELLDYVSEQVRDYEERALPIPDAPPHETLRFLMQSNNLKQSEIAGIPQSHISQILSGKRAISKQQARILANKFSVSAAVFL